MPQRFATIWFRYLPTDWYTRRHPECKGKPLVLYQTIHGSMQVAAANAAAEAKGIFVGTLLADARALEPMVMVAALDPNQFTSVLEHFAKWFIRYAPVVAVDGTDGLIINCSGCCHLWGGESNYLQDIISRMHKEGYHIQAAIAGTIGTAWAVTRYGATPTIIEAGKEKSALTTLPAEALRINPDTSILLHKLGLHTIGSFMSMPRNALARRLGPALLTQLDYALGLLEEPLEPVELPVSWQERLHCLDPIVTAKGIAIALQQLIHAMCKRLTAVEKGIRHGQLLAYRTDGKRISLAVQFNKATNQELHIFKLFELNIPTLAPGPGIELFVLQANVVEDNPAQQEKLWSDPAQDLLHTSIAALLDRISQKIGEQKINRYLPAAHYWPERSISPAQSLNQPPTINWNAQTIRPIKILQPPEPILVTAPIPDYPPMLFRHKGKLHKIVKADGPERIEQEWWLQQGQHRDYYYVEDEEGHRYWLFRSGHYNDQQKDRWFLHGYCA